MENVSAPTDPDCDSGSGSDAISQLSTGVPARETDRFGFILGTGLSSDCEGPPPEVIRQREVKWLEIISHWDRFLLKKSSKVKSQCRKGIPPSLRARCWPLLCAATAKMSTYNKIYEHAFCDSPHYTSSISVKERDTDDKLFTSLSSGKDAHTWDGLFSAVKLMNSSCFTRLTRLVCVSTPEICIHWFAHSLCLALTFCVNTIKMIECFPNGGGDTAIPLSLQEGVLFDSRLFSSVLRRACPVADKHLRKHGVEPLMYLTDWFMCLYTRNLPFNTLLRVWDIFFSEGAESEADFQSVKENQSRDTANQREAGQESLCVQGQEGLQSQSESDVGTDVMDLRGTEADVLTPETNLTLPEPSCDSEVNPLPTTQEQSEPRDPKTRREREEEKARKKREKEMEKERQRLERDRERERRKPQTRGKSFQVHSKCSHNMPPPGNKTTDNLVSKRNSAPYFDTYF
uniref:Rab-GAP TBC domain-containing protein n=1 Tax=Lepisosteus oculatus TaxID=7918 RepID=W5MNW0_LEPOC